MKKLNLKIKGGNISETSDYVYVPEDYMYLDFLKENPNMDVKNVIPELLKIYKTDRRITNKKMTFFELGKKIPEYSKNSFVVLFCQKTKEYEAQPTDIFIQHFLLDFYYMKLKCRINGGVTHFMLLWPSLEGPC